jgi:hypothetical protein
MPELEKVNVPEKPTFPCGVASILPVRRLTKVAPDETTSLRDMSKEPPEVIVP